MGDELPTGDDDEKESTEAFGDLDADPSFVLALPPPLFCADSAVGVAVDEIGSGLHQNGAETAIGASSKGTVGAIDLVALMASRKEPGATGDALGVEVEMDGPHLGGEIGDGNDVDAGKGQEEGVGSRDSEAAEHAFEVLDEPGFFAAIVVECDEGATVQVGQGMSRRGLSGPFEDFVDAVSSLGDAGVLEDAFEPFVAGLENLGGAGEDSGNSQGNRTLP